MSRHPFDPLAFSFGALFLFVGVLLLGGDDGGLGLIWVGPLAAVAVSVVLVLAAWPSPKQTDEPPADAEQP